MRLLPLVIKSNPDICILTCVSKLCIFRSNGSWLGNGNLSSFGELILYGLTAVIGVNLGSIWPLKPCICWRSENKQDRNLSRQVFLRTPFTLYIWIFCLSQTVYPWEPKLSAGSNDPWFFHGFFHIICRNFANNDANLIKKCFISLRVVCYRNLLKKIRYFWWW